MSNLTDDQIRAEAVRDQAANTYRPPNGGDPIFFETRSERQKQQDEIYKRAWERSRSSR